MKMDARDSVSELASATITLLEIYPRGMDVLAFGTQLLFTFITTIFFRKVTQHIQCFFELDNPQSILFFDFI